MGRRSSAGVVALLLLAGCSSVPGSEDPAPVAALDASVPATPSAAPTPAPEGSQAPAPQDLADGRALIATAAVDVVDVRDGPDETLPVVHELANPLPRGAPRTFLVEQRQGDWFEVLLPVRPNGSTGWIRAEDVTLSQTGYAIAVDRADFELRLSRDGERVLTSPIAYGTQDTPTPGGRFYVTELLRPPDPDGVYGTYAFGLSGFSDVLLDFAGGEGVIGIHGTNDPGSIGTRVSAGCIRLPDDVVIELAGLLPLGTPVTITG